MPNKVTHRLKLVELNLDCNKVARRSYFRGAKIHRSSNIFNFQYLFKINKILLKELEKLKRSGGGKGRAKTAAISPCRQVISRNSACQRWRGPRKRFTARLIMHLSLARSSGPEVRGRPLLPLEAELWAGNAAAAGSRSPAAPVARKGLSARRDRSSLLKKLEGTLGMVPEGPAVGGAGGLAVEDASSPYDIPMTGRSAMGALRPSLEATGWRCTWFLEARITSHPGIAQEVEEVSADDTDVSCDYSLPLMIPF